MKFFLRLVLVALFLSTSWAAADVVYLANGKELRGRARTEGETVIVETEDGQTVTVKRLEVLYIARSTPPGVKPPAPDPAPKPDEPDKPMPEVEITEAEAVSIARATLPDTVLFFLLRKRLAEGGFSAGLETQIDRYRALAHDRKRKVGGEWAAPDAFIRRRLVFEEHLRDAAEHFKLGVLQSKRSARSRDPKEEKPLEEERKKHLAAAEAKLRQAAASWMDPLLRQFLLGQTEYRAQHYDLAEMHFRKCLLEAPRVAAFYQGRGKALLQLNRHKDALEACMTLLTLQPDSPEALTLLLETANATPGTMVRTPTYKAAQELLALYETGPNSKRKSKKGARTQEPDWMFPGGAVAQPDDSLPVPPMDRLVFRQAVGVPIAANLLLVDRRTVQDAAEVSVRVEAGVSVVGTVGYLRRARPASRAGGGDSPQGV